MLKKKRAHIPLYISVKTFGLIKLNNSNVLLKFINSKKLNETHTKMKSNCNKINNETVWSL